MSYIYLQESEVEFSLESYLVRIAFAQSKLSPTAKKCYCSDKEMESYLVSRFGEISEPSMENHGEESFKKLQEDSLAPMSVLPETTETKAAVFVALAGKARDCGMRWKELLKRCNLDLSLLKIPLILELTGLSKYFNQLTAWGIMHDGVCSNVAISAQTIIVRDCLYLPTPIAHNAKEVACPTEYQRNTLTLAAHIGGRVNPDWNEFRIGLPIKWSALPPLAMHSLQSWQHSQGVSYPAEPDTDPGI